MLRFAGALTAYATRLIVPIIIGAASLGVALLFAILPIHAVTSSASSGPCLGFRPGTCVAAYRGPSAWQQAAAILIGVVGLGVAALIAWWNLRHPRSRPAPSVSRGWQASASESRLRFRIALIAYSSRRALPVVMTMGVIGSTFYVAVMPLNQGYDRFAWQTPVAVLICVIGLGLVFGVAVWNRWHPQARPLPPLPAGWRTGA